jgi:regulatory protein
MTNEEAFSKLLKYCTYQERCHEEVRTKLLSLKVYGNDLENIMSRLIENGFLNEERYAKTYAGSKFRQMGWGRTKIMYQLKFRKISDYCIREAMKEINEEDYIRTLRAQLEKRKKQVEGDKNWIHKTVQHLISKGFEADLVWKELKNEE